MISTIKKRLRKYNRRKFKNIDRDSKYRIYYRSSNLHMYVQVSLNGNVLTEINSLNSDKKSRNKKAKYIGEKLLEFCNKHNINNENSYLFLGYYSYSKNTSIIFDSIYKNKQL